MGDPIGHLINEHLQDTQATIVIDGNGDGIVGQLLAEGWTWDERPAVHCVGKRIRYLRPPASDPGHDHG